MIVKINVCQRVFLNIDVKLLDLIEVVKWKIHKILCIPPKMQTLTYTDEILEDNKTVKYYELKKHSTIFLRSEGE